MINRLGLISFAAGAVCGPTLVCVCYGARIKSEDFVRSMECDSEPERGPSQLSGWSGDVRLCERMAQPDCWRR